MKFHVFKIRNLVFLSLFLTEFAKCDSVTYKQANYDDACCIDSKEGEGYHKRCICDDISERNQCEELCSADTLCKGYVLLVRDPVECQLATDVDDCPPDCRGPYDTWNVATLDPDGQCAVPGDDWAGGCYIKQGFDPTPTTMEPPTTKLETTTHSKTTMKPSTSPSPTDSSTSAPYDCMDLTVEKCRDETLDVIETFSVGSLDDCYTLCATVYEDVCNSYIYKYDSGNCSIVQDHFHYIDGCDVLGAGEDTVSNCLMDDDKYPDMCKKMVESECEYDANVISIQNDILNIEECLQLSMILHGQHYLYDNDEKECTIYDGTFRTCSVHRGVKDNLPSTCPN